MPECYVRGNTIKYLRVPDEVFFDASVLPKLLFLMIPSVDALLFR